jgi:excisionase family DNA binding protein
VSTQLLALHRAAQHLSRRLEHLESRLSEDSRAIWREYRETAAALVSILAQAAPGRRGELLTTAQMAERFNVSEKTVLKWKAQGHISPAHQQGKLIRWRGDEVPEKKISTRT